MTTRLLAWDTTTWWGSMALVEADSVGDCRVVAEAGLFVRDSHAAQLMVWIDRLMSAAGWSKNSLDRLVATRGPGSFTGIRIGLGTLSGMALATDRPATTVTTLLAMVEAFGPAAVDRVPLIPAGRGELCGARYDPSSSPPVELAPPWLGPPERLSSPEVDDPGRPAVIFGHDHALWCPEVGRCERLTIGETPRGVAAAAARLALHSDDASTDLTPVYLRPPDARLPGEKP